jgi:predicted tellurium resistance membrane protein TerC
VRDPRQHGFGPGPNRNPGYRLLPGLDHFGSWAWPTKIFITAMARIMAVGVILLAAKATSDFAESYPTMKILALSFLILVRVTFVVKGLDVHVPIGFISFAMAFSVGVEMMNIRMRAGQSRSVKLQKTLVETDRNETA